MDDCGREPNGRRTLPPVPALSPRVVLLKIRGNFLNATCFPADKRANPTGGGGECRQPEPQKGQQTPQVRFHTQTAMDTGHACPKPCRLGCVGGLANLLLALSEIPLVLCARLICEELRSPPPPSSDDQREKKVRQGIGE